MGARKEKLLALLERTKRLDEATEAVTEDLERRYQSERESTRNQNTKSERQNRQD